MVSLYGRDGRIIWAGSPLCLSRAVLVILILVTPSSPYSAIDILAQSEILEKFSTPFDFIAYTRLIAHYFPNHHRAAGCETNVYVDVLGCQFSSVHSPAIYCENTLERVQFRQLWWVFCGCTGSGFPATTWGSAAEFSVSLFAARNTAGGEDQATVIK